MKVIGDLFFLFFLCYLFRGGLTLTRCDLLRSGNSSTNATVIVYSRNTNNDPRAIAFFLHLGAILSDSSGIQTFYYLTSYNGTGVLEKYDCMMQSFHIPHSKRISNRTLQEQMRFLCREKGVPARQTTHIFVLVDENEENLWKNYRWKTCYSKGYRVHFVRFISNGLSEYKTIETQKRQFGAHLIINWDDKPIDPIYKFIKSNFAWNDGGVKPDFKSTFMEDNWTDPGWLQKLWVALLVIFVAVACPGQCFLFYLGIFFVEDDHKARVEEMRKRREAEAIRQEMTTAISMRSNVSTAHSLTNESVSAASLVNTPSSSRNVSEAEEPLLSRDIPTDRS